MTTQWWADFLTHMASPYDFNPLDINPSPDYLANTVDFAKVRACRELKLFVAATNVRNGKIKVFEGPELTADHIMASACLPYLFSSWKSIASFIGMGDSLAIPHCFHCFIRPLADIVVVQINPIERHSVPRSAHAIGIG